MFIRIYALPISYMIWIAISGIILWIVFGRIMNKWWKVFNSILLPFSILVILYVTIFNRSTGEYEVSMIPFISFKKAQIQVELYRAILLNCLMYIPFGLGLAGTLPERYSLKRCYIIMVLSGAFLSVLSEGVQFLMNLGNAELDDFIFNVLGMIIAAISLSLKRVKFRFDNING